MVGEITHKVEESDFTKGFDIKEIKTDLHFAPKYHYDDNGNLVIDSIDIVR